LACTCGAAIACGGDETGDVDGAGATGMAACCAAAGRMSAPHLLQNADPLDGAPHLLQNLVAGEVALASTGGGAGVGSEACGVAGTAGLAARRLSAPHFTQNIPLTGDPHLLQKFAMVKFSFCPDDGGQMPTGQPAGSL